MSVRDRSLPVPRPVRGAVLTVSDSRTAETDTSGQAIASLLESAGHVVAARALVRDEAEEVAARIGSWVRDADIDIIITTGGTGIASRPATSEAIARRLDPTIPGFGEIFRRLSFDDIGTAAMLTRATAGITGHTAVFVLPGSEHAVRLAMTRLILPELGHIIRELSR
jgi:molybdenum cofactor biosynthesis protein B